jgi:pimeloyl-ACP methyl ester carboxylesterase
MLSPKPTLLIIHGLSHSPAHFAPIINLFSKAGYETVCPQNPTFDSQPPFKNFLDDVAALSTELTKLVEVNEKDVIVIMHSYGGIVGTQAITEVLSKAWREKEGKKGGVVRLLYLCAYVMGMGQSASSLDPGMIPHFITINVRPPLIFFTYKLMQCDFGGRSRLDRERS